MLWVQNQLVNAVSFLKVNLGLMPYNTHIICLTSPAFWLQKGENHRAVMKVENI